MSVGDAVRRGQQAAEQLMVDEVTITRSAGPGTLNVSTGLLTTSTVIVAEHVPARVRVPTTSETTSLFGEEQVTLSRYVVCLPHDADVDLAVDDVIEVVASCTEPLVGRRLRVLSVPAFTFNLYRMVPCELVE